MLGRFRMLGEVVRTGRLAWRLARDSRVPLAAKLVLAATLVYLGSPIDVAPDWLPFLGQADDLVALVAGLNLFIRACPRRVVQEHEDAIDGRRSSRDGSQRPGRSDDNNVIEGQYRVVR